MLSALAHALVLALWIGVPPSATPNEPPAPETAMMVELAPTAPEPVKHAPQAPPAEHGGNDIHQIPQLQEGALANRSSPATPEKPAAAPPVPNAVTALKPKKAARVTQNEHDFVLSKVLRHWALPKELAQGQDGVFSIGVTVRADGYFADQYDAHRKWNPAEAYDGYNSLPPQSLERRIIDSMYQAARQAQPIALPPALREKAPFDLKLSFRAKDVPR